MFESTNPRPRRDAGSFGWSAALHLAALAAAVLTSTLAPETIRLTKSFVAMPLYVPLTAPEPPRVRQPPIQSKQPKQSQRRAAGQRASIPPPALPRAPEPEALRQEPPSIAAVSATPVRRVAAELPMVLSPPKATRPLVRTGVLSAAVARRPDAAQPPQWQLAGFASLDPGTRRASSAPRPQPPGLAGFRAAQAGGPGRRRSAGQSRAAGTAAFGAVTHTASRPVVRRPVAEAGFAAVVAAEAKAAAPSPRQGRLRPADLRIRNKPRPRYTAEARALRIEGQVVLKVIFEASGVVRVLSVVQGLGHGLDQNAVRAAEAIEFEPARRGGRPVDFAASVQIRFQLAY